MMKSNLYSCLLALSCLGAISGCSSSANVDTMTSQRSGTDAAPGLVTSQASPGHKLVEFCDAAYTLEVPQAAECEHAPDQCVLRIRLPNHADLQVQMLEPDRIAEEIDQLKVFQNPKIGPPQKININGMMFEKNELTGIGVDNAPKAACCYVSTEDGVLKGYRLAMTCWPDNPSAYSDMTQIAMTLRKK